MKSEVLLGDCREVMKAMPDNSVDAIVCDPPYGLSDGPTKLLGDEKAKGGFMGRAWDHGVPGPDFWAEALRVAKPGAFLLAFGGTRSHHRLMCAIEDAGWELRDCISGENIVLRYYYGSGFPKNLDVSKAVDAEMFNRWLAANPEQAARRKKLLKWAKTKERPQKKRWVKIIERGFNRLAGTEREVVGAQRLTGNACVPTEEKGGTYGVGVGTVPPQDVPITAAATPEAAEAEGIGTALKPSWEPIIVARKPFKGTVAQNFLEHGTGGLNIDACRIGTDDDLNGAYTPRRQGNAWEETGGMNSAGAKAEGEYQQPRGRWPANLVLGHLDCDDGCVPDCPVRGLDEQSGPAGSNSTDRGKQSNDGIFGDLPTGTSHDLRSDGGASRFFYTAKAARHEREAGLHGRDSRNVNDGRKTDIDNPYQRGDTQRKNIHTTVKPVSIMRWLVKLVARKGQVVLDPFAGSGTTGIACKHEGMDFIGIDLEPEHVEIAKKRIAQASIDTGTATVEDADEVGGSVQLGLFGK